MWKNILAYSIVSLSLISIFVLFGVAFYIGGWGAFFMFIGAFVGLFGGLGFLFLIIWAFCYVFKS